MSEFFENKFVVDVSGTGHGGVTTCTVLSTPDQMSAMVAALAEALAVRKEQPDMYSHRLWGDCATIARGATSGVMLEFRLAKDLTPFHVRPSFWSKLRGSLTVSCWISLLCLAFVGFAFLVKVASLETGTEASTRLILNGAICALMAVWLAAGVLRIREGVAKSRLRRGYKRA